MKKEDIKKILGKQDNAKDYLKQLSKYNDNLNLPITKKGNVNLKSDKLWDFVEKSWESDLSKGLIRKMFRQTPKYIRGKNALNTLTKFKEEFIIKFKEIGWAFTQSDFDNYIQRINNNPNMTRDEKDERIATDCVKNSWMKELNTLRNDFIETLIFEKSKNIIPTLSHSRGVDFFINSEKWDQKVAKSPTNQFKKDFGDDYINTAINKPELVAEYLYKYQDEERFDADNRILVVYLKEDISEENIVKTIDKIDLKNPLNIIFNYKHKKTGIKEYNSKCYVILLY